MNKTGLTAFSGIVATSLFTASLLAQSSAQDGASPAVHYPPWSASDNSVASGDAAAPASAEPPQYAATLDGTGLISMDHTRTIHLLLGSTGVLGWDTNPDNLSATVSTTVYALSPYIGLQSSTPRTQMVVQYQPTFTQFSSSAYSSQTVHVGSASVLTNLNPRWSMDGKVYASYGQDSIRFLAPQQTVAVGGVPGTSADSAVYLRNAGKGTNVEGGFGASYKQTERDTFSLAVADNFSRFPALSGDNSVATTTFSYDHGVSPRLAFLTYGQGAYYYGEIHCAGAGGGIGIKGRLGEGSYFSLSGGPQFDTSACKSQQGFAFNTSLGTQLTGRSQIYLIAGRQPTVSYLGGGLWQTSVAGGYQRRIGTQGTLSFDVSHVSSDSAGLQGAYTGTYFDGVYSRRLLHGLLPSLSYRGYTGTSGGSSVSRNAVMFSLAWSPEAGHIFQ